MTAHGKASVCQRGCRCAECTEANRLLTRRSRLARQGWSLDEYARVFEAQDGLCAICRETDARFPQLMADHDHATGLHRGLLCSRCNLVLGNVEDSPAILLSVFEYLGRFM